MYSFILDVDENISVFLGKDRFEILKGKLKILEFNEQKNFEFDVLPKSELLQIQHIDINFDGENCFSNCKNLKIIKLNKNKYFLKIFTKNVKNCHKKCKKVLKNNIIFNFFENGLVEIENESELLLSEQFDFCVVDADVLELKDGVFCLKLYGTNNAEKSIVIDNNFLSVLSFDSAVVEVTENGFKVLTNLHDIACHGFVEVFEIDNQISKVDEYSVYLKGAPQNGFNQNVLPIYFLQCVKANDFYEAKRCLSNELSSKASAEHLKAYFGGFVDILSFENKIYLIYQDISLSGLNNNFFAKEVSFKIQDKKIVDIS